MVKLNEFNFSRAATMFWKKRTKRIDGGGNADRWRPGFVDETLVY